MKTLVKEIEFGNAIAAITVSSFTQKINLDGIETGNVEVITTSEVRVMKDGKVIETASFARVSGYQANPRWFDEMGLGQDQQISRVGKNAITLGAEAGRAVNAAIEEMKAELTQEFGFKTEQQIEKEDEIEEVNAIIEQAQKEGVANLMTDAELKEWRVRYNNLHNEGGEGYIPLRISQEQYQRAIQILKGEGVR